MVFTTPNSDNPDPFACLHTLTALCLHPCQHRPHVLYPIPSGRNSPCRWYLVSVNLECSLSNPTSADCHTSGTFAIDFYCHHPDDRSSSDACARWWREWHRYSTDPTDGSIIFSNQVLFRPNQQPSADQYITWSDVVPLADPSVALLGPFDLASSAPFSQESSRRSSNQWVPLIYWQQLCSICASHGILLPSVSAQPIIHSRWTKTKKQKRQP